MGLCISSLERLANEMLERWKCSGLLIAVVDGDDASATVSPGFLAGLSFYPCTFKPTNNSFLFVTLHWWIGLGKPLGSPAL